VSKGLGALTRLALRPLCAQAVTRRRELRRHICREIGRIMNQWELIGRCDAAVGSQTGKQAGPQERTNSQFRSFQSGSSQSGTSDSSPTKSQPMFHNNWRASPPFNIASWFCLAIGLAGSTNVSRFYRDFNNIFQNGHQRSALLLAVVHCFTGIESRLQTWQPVTFLLPYFFAAIGLNATSRTLISGGRTLLVLVAVTILYMILYKN